MLLAVVPARRWYAAATDGGKLKSGGAKNCSAAVELFVGHQRSSMANLCVPKTSSALPKEQHLTNWSNDRTYCLPWSYRQIFVDESA
jgi:hypothetical protein